MRMPGAKTEQTKVERTFDRNRLIRSKLSKYLVSVPFEIFFEITDMMQNVNMLLTRC